MRSKAQALKLTITGFFLLGFFGLGCLGFFGWVWVFYETKVSLSLNVLYDPPIRW